MIDLKNYVPEHPEFKLPKGVSFPKVIFEGAKSMDEIRKHLSGEFIAESMPSVKAIRLLDEYERTSIRANYAELMEDEQPKLEESLADIESQCKAIIKEAKDKLQAVTTQIRDLVYQVNVAKKKSIFRLNQRYGWLCADIFCITPGSMGNFSCAE